MYSPAGQLPIMHRIFPTIPCVLELIRGSFMQSRSCRSKIGGIAVPEHQIPSDDTHVCVRDLGWLVSELLSIKNLVHCQVHVSYSILVEKDQGYLAAALQPVAKKQLQITLYTVKVTWYG